MDFCADALDPCWVCRVWRAFLIALAIFVFFGYLGKGLVFAEKHDLEFVEVIRMGRFWSPDGQFWLWGTVSLLVGYFVLIFVKIFFKALWAGCKKACCPRRRNNGRYVDLERAAALNLPARVHEVEGE